MLGRLTNLVLKKFGLSILVPIPIQQYENTSGYNMQRVLEYVPCTVGVVVKKNIMSSSFCKSEEDLSQLPDQSKNTSKGKMFDRYINHPDKMIIIHQKS